jgi:hypothetical protein
MAKRFRIALALAALPLAALPLAALAQGRQHMPDLTTLLGIDADKAAQVHSILKAEREKRRAAMQSIQAETDAQLATVLTPAQIAQLKAAMPHPPAPGGRPASNSVTQ